MLQLIRTVEQNSTASEKEIKDVTQANRMPAQLSKADKAAVMQNKSIVLTQELGSMNGHLKHYDTGR